MTKPFLIDNCESIGRYHHRGLKLASNGLAQTYSNIFKIAFIVDKYYEKYICLILE